MLQIKKNYSLVVILAGLTSVTACSEKTQQTSQLSDSSQSQITAQAYLDANEIYNPESVIPPQCYTDTQGKNNPCYVCHQSYSDGRPNVMNDGALQGTYAFSEVGESNSWQNLFVDRQKQINQIKDGFIANYVNQDNYTPFIESLKSQNWQGIIPEIKNLPAADKAFAKHGIAKDGSHWVAYNYKPFPSTFWPTNGSTGDAMIRLPKIFRELNGQYNETIYLINLALVELAIKGAEQVSIIPVDENSLAVDLDNNGNLTIADKVVKRSHYIGDAKHIELADMLYPQDTEFLHTVRYIGLDESGQLGMSKRMKEVRYMRKYRFRDPISLKSAYYKEVKEKHFENLPLTANAGYKGIGNGFGWALQAFIEDKQGKLRQQTHEELSFCNGCHKTVGTTIDQVFSFARKVDGVDGWGYLDLKKIKDVPNFGQASQVNPSDIDGEYLTYMQRVGGGDEFRQNEEMLDLWFDQNGHPDRKKIASLDNIYQLIMPSKRRALDLNKAYYTIVQEQSYIYGRDATIKPARNVIQQVNPAKVPLDSDYRYQWDIRLDWTN
ncbi:hypothetical protein DS2_11778 [Catenovulum agarivorans DS-2]|uniref:Lipoprotein n=1 Tax=Catenovulum agarivorans DS-2 TaxID=1328313 RepID=W7QCL5_9ALTE|nr:hypothetical protein [Catenovulum agarivorans]EWH09646.1 hypothetical protein DS2_11778 [Catenovulum agarivorans DS-2]